MVNSWYVMLWKSDKNFNNVMRMCIDDKSFGISYNIDKDLRYEGEFCSPWELKLGILSLLNRLACY